MIFKVNIVLLSKSALQKTIRVCHELASVCFRLEYIPELQRKEIPFFSHHLTIIRNSCDYVEILWPYKIEKRHEL